MSAASPEPKKEPAVESSSNNGNGTHASDVDPESERTQRIRKLETRVKECEQRTLDDIAETTSVTLRLKEKLASAADTGRIKIRKTRIDVPATDAKSPSTPQKAPGHKNGVGP